MRIQVDCAKGGEPRAFVLGMHRLHVAHVLESTAEDSKRRYRVRVIDGREFTLRNDLTTGDWELVRVNAHRG